MALDDALLEARSEGSIGDCMRFFQFHPSAVTIGRFQSLEREVDTFACAKEGVDIVRRPTGGGTVFHHDSGELTYAVIMGITPKTKTIAQSFEHVCASVVHGLRALGVTSEFSPVNDITVNGKKISGSAQARRKSALLIHGTVMYATSLPQLARLLKVSRAKLKGKGVPSVEKRVTTLEREGVSCNLNEVMAAMKSGFELQFGKLNSCSIPEHVSLMTQKLHDSKYVTNAYTQTLP